MNICYGTTGWALFFSFCEVLMTIIIGFYYTKSVYFIYKNEQNTRFEFLDWILIFLSIFQIYFMLFSVLIGFYFGFTVIQEILKFSQNFIIGGILLYQILIWHKYVITLDIVKYFVASLLIIDIISLTGSLAFEYSFFEKDGCKSNTLIILIIIVLILDVLIISFAVYKNLEEKNDTKSLNILVEDQHNLNDLLQRFATNIKKMKKYYLIIVIFFTLSFFVDVYYKLIMTNNVITYNDMSINIKDLNLNTSVNNTYYLNLNSTQTTDQTLTCTYYGDFADNFNLKEYLICTISFFFRDLGPHIYIYLALFIYKPNINSRSSSFIELI